MSNKLFTSGIRWNLPKQPAPTLAPAQIPRVKTIRNAPEDFPGAVLFGRNQIGSTFALGTTPVLLVQESYSRPVSVINTARSSGIQQAIEAFNGTLSAAGNTQDNPVDCGGFETCHVHLTISAVSGTWDIYAQSYDSLQEVWYDTQQIFTGLAAATDSGYTQFGPLGVAEQLAFRFNPTAPGAITCALTAFLKVGKHGGGKGLLASAAIAYVGGRSVNSTSGFPILPSQSQIFQLEEGTELWAMSDDNVTIKIFLL